MAIENSLLLLDWLKFGASLIFGILSVLIYRKIKDNPKGVMNNFQLETGKIITEYKMLMAANLLAVLMFGFYFYNGIRPEKVTLKIAKGLYAIDLLLYSAVFYRWVKRFQ